MPNTIAYMLTWTTYGTWLQGDYRGYVKDGTILRGNSSLLKSNAQRLIKDEVRLSQFQCHVITEAIHKKASDLKQIVYALSVSRTHLHIVLSYVPVEIGLVVRHYKNSAHAELRKHGFVGKLWTKGFDKRYCFDKNALSGMKRYVDAHNKKYLAP